MPALRSAPATDALCLAGITFLSALPYLPGLGFYSDDWGLLAGFRSVDQSGSLLGSVVEGFAARPVQGLYQALQFKLFGLDPLGYHIVNTTVIAGSVALLYLLLLRLRFGRAPSFATALLFVMLPQLSTVRVWYAASQIPLSMALMLVSMHWQLSFARSGNLVTLLAAAIAAVLSIGAYEIFAPLLAGFAAALGAVTWRDRAGGRGARSRQAATAAVVVLALIFLAVAYKLAFSGRTAGIADPQRYLLGLFQLVRPDYDWRLHSGLNIFAAPFVHFWLPVRGWATGAIGLLRGQAGLPVIAVALAIAACAWWRIRHGDGLQEQASPKLLLAAGIAVFVLGHATFLLVPAITFAPTGVGNRAHVAAAIGVAMILVSVIVFATRAVAPRLRRPAFALAVTAVSVAAFARLSAIEQHWVEAARVQERILSAARSDLEGVPAGSTVILDGVCPYHGPAIVFEDWYLGGALTLTLRRRIVGDVVSPRMSLTETGLQTSIYREPAFHPYGPRLFMYDVLRHLLVPLTDAGAARRYFESRRPANCPAGYVGRGVEV